MDTTKTTPAPEAKDQTTKPQDQKPAEDPKVEEAKELKEEMVDAVIEGTVFPQE